MKLIDATGFIPQILCMKCEREVVTGVMYGRQYECHLCALGVMECDFYRVDEGGMRRITLAVKKQSRLWIKVYAYRGSVVGYICDKGTKKKADLLVASGQTSDHDQGHRRESSNDYPVEVTTEDGEEGCLEVSGQVGDDDVDLDLMV